MKLRDFTQDPDLNRLRRMMSATRDGSYTIKLKPNTLTPDEWNKLEKEGIDVGATDLEWLEDNTIGYRNSRVLVYTRDVAIYGGQFAPPKFHVAHCSTLYNILAEDRFERYVATVRQDGEFSINKIDRGGRTPSLERLGVCQNCLGVLAFDGFSSALPWSARKALIKDFSAARFFAQYPKSPNVAPQPSNQQQPPMQRRHAG